MRIERRACECRDTVWLHDPNTNANLARGPRFRCRCTNRLRQPRRDGMIGRQRRAMAPRCSYVRDRPKRSLGGVLSLATTRLRTETVVTVNRASTIRVQWTIITPRRCIAIHPMRVALGVLLADLLPGKSTIRKTHLGGATPTIEQLTLVVKGIVVNRRRVDVSAICPSNRSRPGAATRAGGSIPHCVRSIFGSSRDRAFHSDRLAAQRGRAA